MSVEELAGAVAAAATEANSNTTEIDNGQTIEQGYPSPDLGAAVVSLIEAAPVAEAPSARDVAAETTTASLLAAVRITTGPVHLAVSWPPTASATVEARIGAMRVRLSDTGEAEATDGSKTVASLEFVVCLHAQTETEALVRGSTQSMPPMPMAPRGYGIDLLAPSPLPARAYQPN